MGRRWLGRDFVGNRCGRSSLLGWGVARGVGCGVGRWEGAVVKPRGEASHCGKKEVLPEAGAFRPTCMWYEQKAVQRAVLKASRAWTT